MTFLQMKMIESELVRLEQSAFTADEHLASWSDFAGASYEALSKCCGTHAWHEELQTADAFEHALAGLFASWCRGRRRAQLVTELAEIDLQSDIQSDALCTNYPRKQDFYETCGCQN